MGNKFKIRNLTNELRNLEKKIQKIEKELKDLQEEKVEEVLLEGDMQHNVKLNTIGKYAQATEDTDKYKVKMYRYANKTICELTWINLPTKNREVFIGEAICCPEDVYHPVKGMNIALLKALKECYDYRISKY